MVRQYTRRFAAGGIGSRFPDEPEEDEIDISKWPMSYKKFIRDMEANGFKWEEYRGRFYYHGPAVRTDEQGLRGPTLQDVMRVSSVPVQWDNLGLHFIVYPK